MLYCFGNYRTEILRSFHTLHSIFFCVLHCGTTTHLIMSLLAQNLLRISVQSGNMKQIQLLHICIIPCWYAMLKHIDFL